MMDFLKSFTTMCFAAAAGLVLIALGEVSDSAIRWDDVAGWLAAVDPLDAVVEAVRLVALAVAAYLVVTAALVTLADVLGALRLVGPARALRGLARLVAAPALRRRVVEATAACTLAVTSLGSTAPAWASSARPVAVTATPVAQTT